MHAELDLSDHRAGESARQPDRVAHVVVVAVRDEDRVDAFRLELRGGARGIAGQERIDVDPVARGRVEAERRMPEPGDRSSHRAQVTGAMAALAGTHRGAATG